MRKRIVGPVACALAIVAGACSPAPVRSDLPAPEAGQGRVGAAPVAVIDAVWETPRTPSDNIDSPAVWHGPGGEHWVLASAKESDTILVFDASTGEPVRRAGGAGSAPGRLERPNGLAVADDVLFVVERDNARVQAFSLPDFSPLGSFGQAELVQPFGIAVVPQAAGVHSVFVTDNGERARRVRHYRVELARGSVAARLAQAFGDAPGPGALQVVESIAADALHDRLLIAEEQEGASTVKVFSLDGSFRGEVLPAEHFPGQAEGIALYACGDVGYWIATDQGKRVNTFHVFDRVSLEHLGSFRGRTVLNTDGVALTRVPFPDFESGAFFAVHDDGGLAAFRWADVAAPLALRADCPAPEPSASALRRDLAP